jgi:hemerythrin-like domain-containing protein
MDGLILIIKHMNPIHGLIQNHEVIKTMLRALEAMGTKMAQGEMVPAADLESGIAFFEEYADKYHIRKEEEYLFPMMQESGDERMAALSQELEKEHDEVRKHVESMKGIVQQGEEGTPELAQALIPHVKEVKDMLKEHYDKEENTLFPTAEKILSEDQMKKMEEGAGKIEKEIGADRYKELEEMPSKMEEKYGG